MALNKPEMIQNKLSSSQMRGDIKKKKDVADQIEQIAELDELGTELNPITADNMLAEAPASVMSDASPSTLKAGAASSAGASAGASAMTIGFGIAGAAVVVAAAANSSDSNSSTPAATDDTDTGGVGPIYSGPQTLNVQDGPIAESRVYLDANGNGLVDANVDIFLGITDANGNLTVTGELADILAANPNATIMATGGYDIELNAQRIADGLEPITFAGVLKAPVGAAVVNPLTTVMTALVDAGLTTEEANLKVLESFGLDASLDLTQFNPIAVMASGEATSEQQAIAFAAKQAAVQIANVLTAIQTLGGGDVAFYAGAIESMAGMLNATQGTVSLSSNQTILSLLPEDTGGNNDGARESFAQALAQANFVIAMALTDNAIIAAQQAVQTVTDAAEFVQSVLADIGEGAGFTNISEVGPDNFFNSPLPDTTVFQFSDTQRLQEINAQINAAEANESALQLAQIHLSATRAINSDESLAQAVTDVEGMIEARNALQATIDEAQAVITANASLIATISDIEDQLAAARLSATDESLADALASAQTAMEAHIALHGTDQDIQAAVNAASDAMGEHTALTSSLTLASADLNDDVTANGSTVSLETAVSDAQMALGTHVTAHGTGVELADDLTAAQTALASDVTAKGDQTALEAQLSDAQALVDARAVLQTAQDQADQAVADHVTAHGTDISLQDDVDATQALVDARTYLENDVTIASNDLAAARLIASDESLEQAATDANDALTADVLANGETSALETANNDAQAALATHVSTYGDNQAVTDALTSADDALSADVLANGLTSTLIAQRDETQANIDNRIVLDQNFADADAALDAHILAHGDDLALSNELSNAQAILNQRNDLNAELLTAQTSLADARALATDVSLTDAQTAAQTALDDDILANGSTATLAQNVTDAQTALDADPANQTLIDNLAAAQSVYDARIVLEGNLTTATNAVNDRNALIAFAEGEQQDVDDHIALYGSDVTLTTNVDNLQTLWNERETLNTAYFDAQTALMADQYKGTLEEMNTTLADLEAKISVRTPLEEAKANAEAVIAMRNTLNDAAVESQMLVDERASLELALTNAQGAVSSRVLLMTILTNEQSALDADITANGTTVLLNANLADAQALLADRLELNQALTVADSALQSDISANGALEALTLAVTTAQMNIEARLALETAITAIEALIEVRTTLEDNADSASELVDNRTALVNAQTSAQEALDAYELANGNMTALQAAYQDAIAIMGERIDLAAAIDRAQSDIDERNALINNIEEAQSNLTQVADIENLQALILEANAALAADIALYGDMTALEAQLVTAGTALQLREALINEVANLQGLVESVDLNALNQEANTIRTSSDYQFMDTITGFEFGVDMIGLLGSNNELLGQPQSLSVFNVTTDETDVYASLSQFLTLQNVEHSSAALVEVNFTDELLASESGTYLFVNNGDAAISQTDDIWVKMVSTTGDINSVTLANTFVSTPSNEV